MVKILVYVAYSGQWDKNNIERAKKITHDLQVKDLSNCYVCPLEVFSHLEYGEISHDNERELCLDLLSSSDRLIMANEIPKSEQFEVDFAKLVKMEVFVLDEIGQIRPFTE